MCRGDRGGGAIRGRSLPLGAGLVDNSLTEREVVAGESHTEEAARHCIAAYIVVLGDPADCPIGIGPDRKDVFNKRSTQVGGFALECMGG